MFPFVNASAGEEILAMLFVGVVSASALMLRCPSPSADTSRAVRVAKVFFGWTSVILLSLILILGLLSEIGR